VLVENELPLAASSAVDVVVVDEFHESGFSQVKADDRAVEFHTSIAKIAKIKTNSKTNLPKIKSVSMMDSRFMPQS
jgi:hypothetical protein